MHWLPESPRVIAARGDREAAKQVLRRIYHKATDEIIDMKLTIIDLNIQETTRLQRELSFLQRTRLLWSHKPYRRAIIAVCGMQAYVDLRRLKQVVVAHGDLVL